MAARDEYMRILNAHGFSGDVANLLVDMFVHYSEHYLADVLGQYYNSSILKASNMDALLQLSLDMGYPVWRGSNTVISINIKNANAFVAMQPLQEVFSYGNHFFYYAGDEPITLSPDKNPSSSIKLVHTTIPKRVIEFKLDKNEIYVIDDKNPISEHIAFYVIYSQGVYTNVSHVKHTRIPRQFWAFTADINPEENSSFLKDILVLTTPDYGIYVKFSNRILDYSGIKKIRLEYLNFTGMLTNFDILIKLYDHLTNKLGLELFESMDNLESQRNLFKITTPTPPEDEKSIRENLTKGIRFNGIIRSITDIATYIREEFMEQLYDIKIFHYIDKKNIASDVKLPNIFYLLIVIPKPGFTVQDIYNFYQLNIQSIWHSNLPKLNMLYFGSNVDYQNIINNTETNVIQVNPSDIVIAEPAPVRLIIRYDYEGYNKNIVRAELMEYTAKYVNKIIELINPNEIFTFFAKNDNVKQINSFVISLELKDSNGNLIEVPFLHYGYMNYTVHTKGLEMTEEYFSNIPKDSPIHWSQTIKLIKIDMFYNTVTQHRNFKFIYGQDSFEYYFQFISEVTVVDVGI